MELSSTGTVFCCIHKQDCMFWLSQSCARNCQENLTFQQESVADVRQMMTYYFGIPVTSEFCLGLDVTTARLKFSTRNCT